jgi:hypothetical protein
MLLDEVWNLNERDLIIRMIKKTQLLPHLSRERLSVFVTTYPFKSSKEYTTFTVFVLIMNVTQLSWPLNPITTSHPGLWIKNKNWIRCVTALSTRSYEIHNFQNYAAATHETASTLWCGYDSQIHSFILVNGFQWYFIKTSLMLNWRPHSTLTLTIIWSRVQFDSICLATSDERSIAAKWHLWHFHGKRLEYFVLIWIDA